MRSISVSAERQKDVEIVRGKSSTTVYIRRNHVEKEQPDELLGTGDGAASLSFKYWECEEAVAELPPEETPSADEIWSNFEPWFDYVASWTKAKTKTLAQLQADVEYIAAFTGVDLEV